MLKCGNFYMVYWSLCLAHLGQIGCDNFQRALAQSCIASVCRRRVIFESDTDTEVVPKLLKYVYSKIDKLSHHQPTLPELVMEVMSQLEGAFALLIKSSHYPGELVAAKRGSPLIMGIRQGSITTLDGAVNPDVEASAIGKTMELFLASDASAVVEHTNT